MYISDENYEKAKMIAGYMFANSRYFQLEYNDYLSAAHDGIINALEYVEKKGITCARHITNIIRKAVNDSIAELHRQEWLKPHGITGLGTRYNKLNKKALFKYFDHEMLLEKGIEVFISSDDPFENAWGDELYGKLQSEFIRARRDYLQREYRDIYDMFMAGHKRAAIYASKPNLLGGKNGGGNKKKFFYLMSFLERFAEDYTCAA